MARQIQDCQLTFDQTPIDKIKFDPRSRDDIPQILQGLQYLYIPPETRDALFTLLKQVIPTDVSQKLGRNGMPLWKIFVLGVLRVNLNWDYDRLHEMVNTHRKIRQMLGHGLWDDEVMYPLQTLKDNVRLLTPELLDKINQVVVNAGHGLVKKKEVAPTLYGRCDTFVVETNVHYPTDINLLFDAMRQVIKLSHYLSSSSNNTDWRQHTYRLRQVKRAFRLAQQTKRTQYKNESRRLKNEEKVISAYTDYLSLCQTLLLKSKETIKRFTGCHGLLDNLSVIRLEQFIKDAMRQIDQVNRRVIQGEVIPHGEKVFSLYQRHTEWIQKGKVKAPVELGLRTCVLEDQFGFILHHHVMQKETDSDVAVPMVEDTKARFPHLARCSFDKGFYTPNNRDKLNALLSRVILPKKGRLTQAEKKQIEDDPDYQKYRYQHAAIESAINALEVHGLDRCLDHGLFGFSRYVALAVVGRNIQQLGAILHCRKKLKRLKKKNRKSH